MKNLFLIGFMGTGKSTMARLLSERLSLPFLEMDEKIEEQAGMSVTEIFDRFGEEHFRAMETDLLRTLTHTDSQIISCGGGTVLREENVRLMRGTGQILLLTASPSTVLARTRSDNNRPLLKGRRTVSDIEELMNERKSAYEAAADLVVNTDGKTPAKLAEEICALLEKTAPQKG